MHERLVRGMDKAQGVRWLSRETGIPLGDMAGVGDSPSDVLVHAIAALVWSTS